MNWLSDTAANAFEGARQCCTRVYESLPTEEGIQRWYVRDRENFRRNHPDYSENDRMLAFCFNGLWVATNALTFLEASPISATIVWGKSFFLVNSALIIATPLFRHQNNVRQTRDWIGFLTSGAIAWSSNWSSAAYLTKQPLTYMFSGLLSNYFGQILWKRGLIPQE